jgi:hypothetical protein
LKPSDGRRLVVWWQCVLSNGINAAAFLGGILLTIATTTLDDKQAQIRPVAAAGAAVFLILYILEIGFDMLFNFMSDDLAERANGIRDAIYFWLSGLSLLLQILPLAGTLCLFRVMAAFVPGAGWTGFGIIAILAVAALWIWALQLRQLFRDRKAALEPEQQRGAVNIG